MLSRRIYFQIYIERFVLPNIGKPDNLHRTKIILNVFLRYLFAREIRHFEYRNIYVPTFGNRTPQTHFALSSKRGNEGGKAIYDTVALILRELRTEIARFIAVQIFGCVTHRPGLSHTVFATKRESGVQREMRTKRGVSGSVQKSKRNVGV